MPLSLRIIAACLLALPALAQPKLKIVAVGLDDASFAELKKSAPSNVHLVAPLPDHFQAEIADADALITPQFTRDQLAITRHLRWLHILNAGVEDVLPLIKPTPITLTNLKVVLGPEVADHAMALLLALTRGLNQTIPKRGVWEPPENIHEITELRGRTALIIGVGGIGAEIAQRANAFGMSVIGVDPKDPAPSPAIKQMVKPDRLDAVLPQADVIFLAAPETPVTRGMIGPAQFQLMKRGAYFIAVSRGAIYSLDGLVQALSAHRLAGAGVDVTDPEPLPKNHPLWKFKNVVITPHIAGASDRSLTRVVDLLRDNIARFAAGQPLLNTVDKTLGY